MARFSGCSRRTHDFSRPHLDSMIQPRLRTAIIFAGWLWAATTAPSQDNSAGSASGGAASGGAASGGTNSGDNSNSAGGSDQSGGNGASSSFGTGNPNGAQPSTPSTPLWPPLPSPYGNPATPGGNNQEPSTPGSQNNQGGNGNAAGNGTGNGPATGTPNPPAPTQTPGAASAFGYTGAKPPAAAIPTTLPSAYGSSPQIFSTPGISRPRYHYTLSIQAGGDDNVLATPTNAPGSPAVIQKVQISPAIQPVTVILAVPPPFRHKIIGKPHPPLLFRSVTFPGTPARFKKVVVSPAVAPEFRVASPVLQAHGTVDVSFATRRTEFSMHVDLGEYLYSNRPGGKTDPSDAFSLSYAHKITPRLVFRANIGAQYINQPDVQNLNTPTTNVGSYVVEISKFELDYNLTKRFSLVPSISLNGNYYQKAGPDTSNELDETFDLQTRYLWTPRLTVLLEGSYELKNFPTTALRNSTTYYLLLGTEWSLSTKFSDSLRLGESIDQFTENGSASAPYFENTLSWRFDRAGFLSWATRYGFEDPPDAQVTVKSFRTGITAIQAFGPRWKASAGVTYEDRASVSGAPQAQTVLGTSASSTTSQNILFTLGFEYALTRRTSLTGTYTYTDILNTGGVGDYYRNQVFFGVSYSF
jgi:hypothetical protein